ncbi:hypothetical protein Pint_31311 [Pistacia integerrima]|uniref:Uncharacterized protein n=1 Tax=Pistacia integerrima TaxID=434235 RepID=A0ACC0XNK3_9ROSI|nr:hypothetical protein Pint_31311 [Pistacia integerrima]
MFIFYAANVVCLLLQLSSNEEKEAARFAQLWNKIISSFREEDLIRNREMDLLLVPYWADHDLDLIQWPPFLLASKTKIALDMTKDSNGEDQELKKRIGTDPYMSCAVKQCYASFRNIIMSLVEGIVRKSKVIQYMFGEVEKLIEEGTLIRECKKSALPSLYEHFVKLIKYLLDNKQEDKDQVVITFQDMLEVVSRYILMEDQIPSVLTPYYTEEVLFSLKELESPNEDGVSILFYLQKIFPDEWNNFLERVKCLSEKELKGSDELEEELRLWASCRGQTLTRTVRGMMYYLKALELQAFLGMAQHEDLMEGYKAIELNVDDNKGERSLMTQCQAVPDMKFTYVVSCQQYGIHKRSGDHRAQDILRLMITYPSLRVAYIDEEIYRIKHPGPAILGEGKPENQNHAIIFTRGEGLQIIDMNQDNYMEEALKMRNLLQEFLKKHDGVRYPTILGLREHIFTGSVSSLAWFMSNQETSFMTIGQRLLANPLKLIGYVRLDWLCPCFWLWRVRFHYGHPDVFDRLFHLTRGGVSKASKVINLSEDRFAGILVCGTFLCLLVCVDDVE